MDVKDELIRLLRRLEKTDSKKQSHENVSRPTSIIYVYWSMSNRWPMQRSAYDIQSSRSSRPIYTVSRKKRHHFYIVVIT